MYLYCKRSSNIWNHRLKIEHRNPHRMRQSYHDICHNMRRGFFAFAAVYFASNELRVDNPFLFDYTGLNHWHLFIVTFMIDKKWKKYKLVVESLKNPFTTENNRKICVAFIKKQAPLQELVANGQNDTYDTAGIEVSVPLSNSDTSEDSVSASFLTYIKNLYPVGVM